LMIDPHKEEKGRDQSSVRRQIKKTLRQEY